jgi:hypothetical protein
MVCSRIIFSAEEDRETRRGGDQEKTPETAIQPVFLLVSRSPCLAPSRPVNMGVISRTDH